MLRKFDGSAYSENSVLSTHQDSVDDKKRFSSERKSQPNKTVCPECGADEFEDGVRNIQKDGSKHGIQNFYCKGCGRDFLDSWGINTNKSSVDIRVRRVCGNEVEVPKNLVTVETQQNKSVGDTKDLQIVTDQYQKYLIRKQLKQSSIKTYVSGLKFLVKLGADIFDPDNVNYVIGRQNWSDGRKNNIIKAYIHFVRMWHIENKWDRPKMKPQKSHPRPASTTQIVALTSGASRKHSIIQKFMAFTGAIAEETSRLNEKNFDWEQKQVFLKGHKGHEDRWVPLFLFSTEFPEIMKSYMNRYRGFPSASTIGSKFRKYRDKTAKTPGPKSLKKVQLGQFRHWFATQYYRRYRDPLMLKKYMGHKKFETTEGYTKVVPIEKPSYVTRTVITVKEGLKLGEQGWEKYDEIDGVHLYRRMKSFEELTTEKGSETSEMGSWSSMV